MAKQWWALAVATAMTLSTGAAFASGSNTNAAPSSTDRTTQSGTTDDSNTKDTTKPIDDGVDRGSVDRTNQSGVDDQTDTMGDRMNQAGDEMKEKTEHASKKFSDLSSDQVKKVQQKLTDEGFYKGPITGHFGPKTKAALKQFADAKGIELKGDVLDSQLLSQLDLNESDIQPVKGADDKSIDKDDKTVPETKSDSSTGGTTTPSTDTKPQSGSDVRGSSSSTDIHNQSGSSSTDSTLNNGSTGAASGGETSTNPTGVNAGTSPSQSGSSMGGVDTTGRTDTGVSGSSTSSTDIEKQRGSDVSASTNTEIIRQAQLALKDKGLLKTEPSGTLDKDTKSALKAFQKENKLPVTGKLDDKTLAKLGVNTAVTPDTSGTTTTPDTMTTPSTISTPATPQ